ncbi:MAG: hypothetical protein HOP28_15375, partial [Gemmatimonadales bacterium]|nr:hypothetical protein [Gemmatimonadales bacterium]
MRTPWIRWFVSLSIGVVGFSPPLLAQPASGASWQARQLVAVGDPDAATGGTFKELGEHWMLRSGHLVFWAKYG